MKKILLLGSGELGKELTISLKRIGCYVITCDAYENAPAMQVSDQSEVFNMLDKNKLTKIIENHKPDFINIITLQKVFFGIIECLKI